MKRSILFLLLAFVLPLLLVAAADANGQTIRRVVDMWSYKSISNSDSLVVVGKSLEYEGMYPDSVRVVGYTNSDSTRGYLYVKSAFAHTPYTAVLVDSLVSIGVSIQTIPATNWSGYDEVGLLFWAPDSGNGITTPNRTYVRLELFYHK
jgi:hypothetical protein